MYILGLSCYYHDSAACLLKDGNLIAAVEEERFTRIKHDFSFPSNAVKFCLDYAGINGKDLDYVIFHEKPFLKYERIIKTILSTYPRSCRLFGESVISWFKDKLWIKAVISEFLGVSQDKVLFSEHHLSHAASAFFCSPFKAAAILTCDGVGEWATTTLGSGKGAWDDSGENWIKISEEIRFPHSLGLLYSVFTAFLGFEINEGEYKVMGMSSFGKPSYVEKIYELIKINPDGSFKLNMKYFSYHYSTGCSFNENFIRLFGKPRNPKTELTLNEGTDTEERFIDIAASIQKVTEDALIKMAVYLYEKTKLTKLCLAGGVALNCVANYKILQNTPFEDIFIQPAAGDSGAALGAALYLWHCLLGKKRRFILQHAFWGKDYTDNDIKLFLDRDGLKYKEAESEDELVDYVSEALTKQKIIGWHQGRFEWGPRALGNRSILADPRNPEMKGIVNSKIKYREPFRPFAPSVLYEFSEELFNIKEIKNHYPFKFMLYAVPVNSNRIPAVTHVDNTSRIQLVDHDSNPLYYRLIKAFYHKTGIPAILNTSFNLKGESIVNTPADAYNTFKNSGIDILVIGKYILEKTGS